MARVNASQFDNYTQYDSEWLKLPNNHDTVRVQFLYHRPEDIDFFSVHKVEIDGRERMVDCKREYDDPIDACPLCAAGFNPSPTMILSMYDTDNKTVKIWQRGKKFKNKLDSMFNRYGDLTRMVFEIERIGERGSKETTYELFPMPDVAPCDVSQVEKPEFIGSVIMDKTLDEMRIYADTGRFPSNDSNDNSSSRRASEGQSRRGGTRRGF